MSKKEIGSETHNFLALIALCAGLFLLPLLLLGFVTVNGHLFKLLWLLHLLCQVTATTFYLIYFYNLAKSLGRIKSSCFLFAFAILFILAFLQGLLPITERDALIYHLEVPRQWLKVGKITEVSWNEWSYFPMLLGMGYTGLLKQGLGKFVSLYHLSFFILACGISSVLVHSRTKDAFLAALTFLLFLSLPLAIRVGTTPMADMAVVLYMGVAVFFVMQALEDKKIHALILSGLALGLACSSKYLGLLSSLVLVLVLPLYCLRRGIESKTILKWMGIVSGVASLILLPWLIRNYIWTENPLYPFMSALFNAGEEVPFLGKNKPIPYRLQAYGENLLDIILLPFRMILGGEDDNPKKFDGVLSPILLLMFVPFFVRWKKWEPWLLFWYLLIGLHFVFSITLFYAYTRYQLPFMGLIIALVILGIQDLRLCIKSKLNSFVFPVVLVLHFGWVSFYYQDLLKKRETFSYLFGGEARDEYLSRQLSEYPMIAYINENVPRTSKVYLLLTGNKYYYYRGTVQGGYFSAKPVIEWIQSSKESQDLDRKLKAQKIDYIMLHERRVKEVFEQSLNEKEKKLWGEFVDNHLEMLHREGWYLLFKVSE